MTAREDSHFDSRLDLKLVTSVIKRLNASDAAMPQRLSLWLLLLRVRNLQFVIIFRLEIDNFTIFL